MRSPVWRRGSPLLGHVLRQLLRLVSPGLHFCRQLQNLIFSIFKIVLGLEQVVRHSVPRRWPLGFLTLSSFRSLSSNAVARQRGSSFVEMLGFGQSVSFGVGVPFIGDVFPLAVAIPCVVFPDPKLGSGLGTA